MQSWTTVNGKAYGIGQGQNQGEQGATHPHIHNGVCPLTGLTLCGVQPLLLSAHHNTPSMHTQQTHEHTQLTNVSKNMLSTILINPAHSPRGPLNIARAKTNAHIHNCKKERRIHPTEQGFKERNNDL